jgi:hypothetical protein
VLESIVQEGYRFGFFFWLDILATLSMLPECGLIIDFETQADFGNGVEGNNQEI